MDIDAGRRTGRLTLATLNGARLDGAANRGAPRYRTFLAGRIPLPDGGFVLCVVRDMSKTGARLVVDPAVALPNEIELHLLSRNEVFCGAIVWREEDQAGMKFTAWNKV